MALVYASLIHELEVVWENRNMHVHIENDMNKSSSNLLGCKEVDKERRHSCFFFIN